MPDKKFTAENHKANPQRRRMICGLYLVMEFMVALYGFFSSDLGVSHRTLFIILIIAETSAVIATNIHGISDKAHGIIITCVGQIASWAMAFVIGNFSIIHMTVMASMIIASLYEMTAVIGYQLIFTGTSYVIFIVVFAISKMGTDYLRNFIWNAIFIVISELVLAYLVNLLERYKEVIRENSQSSQDMLKVVRMKKHETEEAAAAKTQFLSNMSHEIRTPINAILGMDEIILRDSNEANIIDYAGKIQNAGNTLLSLINDILDFSKIESGRVDLIPENYNTIDLFNELYDMFILKTEDKGLKLSFELSPTLPKSLYGDSLRVKQILTNILSNAVKYTEKGSVTLTADWKRISPDSMELSVAVKDTGIGIRKEDLDKIFNSFERVDEKRNKHIEGTGLGMSITKRLVTLMDGDIHVESDYGTGSTFYVSIQQRLVNAEGIGDFAPNAPVINVGKFRTKSFTAPDAHILVVDDNEMNLVVTKGLLKKLQVQTDTAVSGMQCLALVRQKHYDVIFMDHMMPEMDGIETLKKMKELRENRCDNTPVVALTANAIAGAEEMYLSKGFRSYLPKPIRSARMEEILLKYLPKDLIHYESEEKTALKKQLPKLEGIRYEAGLNYAGEDEGQYRENMLLFVKTAEGKHRLMKDLLTAEDWDRYTIEVHALKSNARYIGAEHLGELAFAHEQAGKARQTDFIRTHWEELEEEWKNITETVRTFLEEKKSRKETVSPDGRDSGIISLTRPEKYLPINKEIYGRKLDKILEALQDYEMDDAVERLKDLLNYDLQPEIRDRIRKALEATDNFDYKMAKKLLTTNRS